MKCFLDNKAWRYYADTFMLITVLFLFRNTDQRVVGAAGHFGFADNITRILVFVISFIMSFLMGYKKVYSKYLFAVLVALFAYLILPIVGFATSYRASEHYFLFYLVLGFINIFLPHIILNFSGLGLGVFIRKKHIKKEQHTE